MDKLVTYSIYLSLILQLITTILPFDGFTVKLEPEHRILQDILGIETFVQIVEMIFYIWIIFAVSNLENVTPRRYIDWSITTPIMLFSTIVFLKYSENQQENNSQEIKIKNFILENKENIIKLFFFNGLMLLFGYLGETNILDKRISIPLGFVFFFLTFKLIYYEYAKYSVSGKNLFYFIFIVWLFYGVAAVMPIKIKNISYNFLDIISKNFYGLFIYYKIKKI